MADDVVLVVDWFARFGGAERVLKEVARMYPDAPLLAMFAEAGAAEALGIDPARVRTTYLERVPGAFARRRWLLPLFGHAIGTLDVGRAQVVVSMSHAVAKNVPCAPGQRHVSYMYTPMRYAHDLRDEYLGTVPAPLRPVAGAVLRRFAARDIAGAKRVDTFSAISQTVADRIVRLYGREAAVIHPPVELDGATAAPGVPGDYYIVLSRLVAYKRVDVAIRAAVLADRRLVVVGSGPELASLQGLAREVDPSGRHVEFAGFVSEERRRSLLAGARALLFPGEEDLGLVGVEAHAAGTPVIAFGRGGMLDVLGVSGAPHTGAEPCQVPGGVLVGASTPEAFARGMAHFEDQPRARAADLAALARRFEPSEFRRQFAAFVAGTDSSAGQ